MAVRAGPPVPDDGPPSRLWPRPAAEPPPDEPPLRLPPLPLRLRPPRLRFPPDRPEADVPAFLAGRRRRHRRRSCRRWHPCPPRHRHHRHRTRSGCGSGCDSGCDSDSTRRSRRRRPGRRSRLTRAWALSRSCRWARPWAGQPTTRPPDTVSARLDRGSPGSRGLTPCGGAQGCGGYGSRARPRSRPWW